MRMMQTSLDRPILCGFVVACLVTLGCSQEDELPFYISGYNRGGKPIKFLEKADSNVPVTDDLAQLAFLDVDGKAVGLCRGAEKRDMDRPNGIILVNAHQDASIMPW